MHDTFIEAIHRGAETLDQLAAARVPSYDEVRPVFRVWSAAEFSVTESLGWIVKGLLPRAELAVIYGESGSGKSFLMLDLVAAIASGREWQGRKVKRGRVVIVAAEGAGGFRKRLLAYAMETGISLDQIDIGVIAANPDLLGDDDLSMAYAINASGGASVVVIDTLAASMPGGNENSGEDMGLVLAHCKRLHRETGALVVLIHHAGKDATRGARGWSGLKAAADVEVEITRSGDQRVARVSKLKDGEDGAEFAFKLLPVVLGIDEDGEPVTSCVVRFDGSAKPREMREPRGQWEKAVLRHAKALLGKSALVTTKELIDATVEATPADPDSKRDRRKEYVWRALAALTNGGFLILKDDRIRLPHEPQMPHQRHVRHAESSLNLPHEDAAREPLYRGSCGSCGTGDSEDAGDGLSPELGWQ